jgi:hypothetical protein
MVCGVPPLVLVDGKGDLIGPFTRPKGVKSLADGHCQGRPWRDGGLGLREFPTVILNGWPGQRLDGIVEVAEKFCQATRPPQSCLRGAGEL